MIQKNSFLGLSHTAGTWIKVLLTSPETFLVFPSTACSLRKIESLKTNFPIMYTFKKKKNLKSDFVHLAAVLKRGHRSHISAGTLCFLLKNQDD